MPRTVGVTLACLGAGFGVNDFKVEEDGPMVFVDNSVG